MALVLSQSPPTLPTLRHRNIPVSAGSRQLTWGAFQQSLRCNSRISCIFSDNRKQDQARKALESALGEKKNEYEKWDKEIKRREEAGGGGNFGGGGWFGWRRWFGGSDGDHFWQEAQQIILTILGIISVFLILGKGNIMLAVVLNPLLLGLRRARAGLTSITSFVTSKLSGRGGANVSPVSWEETSAKSSARESVMKKWGSD